MIADGDEARPNRTARADGLYRTLRGDLMPPRRCSPTTAAVPLGAVGVLALLAQPGQVLTQADTWLCDRVLRRRRPVVIGLARAVSLLGEPKVAYPVIATAAALAQAKPALIAKIGLTVFGATVARAGLCRVLHRPRPPDAGWRTRPDGASFPSRHTTLAALAAGAAWRLVGGSHRSLLPAIVPVTAVVGASRVYLGVHWPTDVVAGGLFAHGWLTLWLRER
jgi:undecaprenyl-diphosphatase